MADNDLNVNYEAVLADLRAKRDKLDAAIAGIEAMLGIAGTTSGNAAISVSATGSISSSIVESDSFFGMSIPDAARKLLSMRKRPQTTQEITDALDVGGLTHQSGDFANTVGSVLNRLGKSDGGVVKLGRAKWGLAAWYPSAKRRKLPGKNGDSSLEDEASIIHSATADDAPHF